VSYLRSLVDGNSDLSIGRQCELLGLPRSSYYYEPIGESAYNLGLMRLLDEQYLQTPFFGVGQFTYWLCQQGHAVNEKRVRRLLRLLDLHAVCPGPHTSKPGDGTEHRVYPYLLKGLDINHPGQVYGTDITYIPLKGGFLYLVAFLDWHSRFVLSWELSNSLDVAFCLQALQQACSVLKPRIINTDQGAQFTSLAFTQQVTGQGINLSMDGKGRAIDNVFTERLWRSLKYEEVYIKSYDDGRDAWRSLDKYFRFYNEQRPHSSLDGKTPREVFESAAS
jgi:putative transposase